MDIEFTGNHYVALPAIDRADGAVREINVLHRGMASLLAWTGAPAGAPLLRFRVRVDGAERPLARVRWERLDRWIPRLVADLGDGVRLAITFCTPGGFDPLVRGGVFRLQLENGGTAATVRFEIEGCWAGMERMVATTRPLGAVRRVVRGHAWQGLALEFGSVPAGGALALTMAEASAVYAAALGENEPAALEPGAEVTAADGVPIRFTISCERRVGAGRRTSVACYFAVAPERDGALVTADRIAVLGAEDLIRRARLDLASLQRATDESAARDIVARNLVFHHYWSAARAIDDDRIYPTRSRSREFGPCAVFDERTFLAWSLPAFALTDPMLAREMLLRALELWSDRPGLLVRYLDGGVLDGAFSLGRLCDWGLALERLIDLTRDDSILGDPLVMQVLHELDEAAWGRLHTEVFLAQTEVLASGEPADHPVSAFDNVLLWRLCKVLQRFWPEERAEGHRGRPRLRGGEEEIEAAFWQRCTTEVEGLRVIACTSDLKGNAAVYDDPAGSLRLLPWLGFCSTDDPVWSNTMELLHSPAYPLWLGKAKFPGLAGRSTPEQASFAGLCADLLGPRRADALELLRRLDLPGGVACRRWNPETGTAADGPYAAAEAGFLVWALLEPAPLDARDARGPREKRKAR